MTIKKKEFHLKMILEIMQNIKLFLLEFLSKVNKISELENSYEKKYQKILEHQMSIYSKVITINDLKQFYLAKLQGYLLEELESGLDQKLQELHPILQKIHESYDELKTSMKFIRVLKNVKLINFPKFIVFISSNLILKHPFSKAMNWHIWLKF